MSRLFMLPCTDCGAMIKIPEESLPGEIVTCSDCGGTYELKFRPNNEFELKRSEQVSEDWGE